jgi:hypothetical protein
MMQKWEIGALVFFALFVAVVGATDVLDSTVVDLLDTMFVQVLLLFVCIGLVLQSPTVGVAAVVSIALVFILRNNSIVHRKLVSPLSTPTLKTEIEYPTRTSDEITVSETPSPVDKVEENPDGQYPLDSPRPMQVPVLREYEYAPLPDTGRNEFISVGASIDEKGALPPTIKPWAGSPAGVAFV